MTARLTLSAPGPLPALAPGAGLEVRPEGDWAVLVDLASPARQALGAPGLWRVLSPGSQGPAARAFELPPVTSELALLVAWAQSTRRGEVPSPWSPPPADDLASWVEPGRLGVRAGVRVARGTVLHPAAGHGRLALVFPELVRLPETLPPSRAAWLDTLLEAVRERWRLVRVGVDAETRAVRAEVDLTGVPAALARPLVQLSLEALHGAVGWALASLSFVVDPSTESRALERQTPTHGS